jgi:hypothetical protein
MVIVMVLAAPALAQDPVANYLQRMGLNHLLALHLEEALSRALPDEREDLQLRLVALYSQLIDETEDPVLREVLEERSLRLLATASAEAGLELQLALLRARYRVVEQVAENHRLRQADPKALQRARDQLPGLVRELNAQRGRIEDQLRLTENRLDRATGSEAATLTARSESLLELSSRATFLTAWALYYQSWLNQRPDNARVAEGHFAKLIGAEGPRPAPEEISLDLREVEAVARSIHGMALCKSVTSSVATAIAWIELLEVSGSYGPLRKEVPAWKIAIYLEHGEYRNARQVLADYSTRGQTLPLTWVRLAAIGALEGDRRSGERARLARETLTWLAAHGELRQVLDLSERYGSETLGHEGFAFRYVRGVQHYERARDAHGSEQPTNDPNLLAGYRSAAEEFAAALEEADADRYPEATASCRTLVAWCRYFEGRFLEARAAFELAAPHLTPEKAMEAMWMAVVSLDRVVQTSREPRHAEELWALIDRVLQRFPNSPHAPKLILKRALGTNEVSPDVVEDLLSIGPESEVYDAAQRRAAYVLFQLFRSARGEERLAYGNEYLAVSLPLVSRAAQSLDPDDDEAVGRYVSRCRRLLEVALAGGIDRVVAAGNVLADLEDLQRLHGVDLSAHRDEFDYRRIQQHLEGEQVAAATTIANRMHERDPEVIWTRLANRALFEYGVTRWRQSEHQAVVNPADLDLVVRFGSRIVDEFSSDPGAIRRPGVLAYYVTLAEARFVLWERSPSSSRARSALELYLQVLEVRPHDAGSLRAAGLLSEHVGEPQRALEYWRLLAAGSPPGTHRWYEAKFRLITLLAEIDPARARAVMDQHKGLDPSLGPEPWASRFTALDERIPPAPGQPIEGDGDGG